MTITSDNQLDGAIDQALQYADLCTIDCPCGCNFTPLCPGEVYCPECGDGYVCGWAFIYGVWHFMVEAM